MAGRTSTVALAILGGAPMVALRWVFPKPRKVPLADLTATDFGELIAERIHAEHVSISVRWLERLRALLSVGANEVFPTDQLLDHIPALIREVSAYLRYPASESVAANTAVMTKARELGELRHSQQASVHQLHAEYRLLDGILASFVQEELDRLDTPPPAGEVVEVLRRLSDAVWMLMQVTLDTFVSEYTGTIASHTSRLEGFNRMVSHELRQPLGTLMYALPLLKAGAAAGDTQRQDQLFDVMERNILRLTQLMEQLEMLSRLQSTHPEPLDVQRTEVVTVAREVARQLREMAEARGVDILIEATLPELRIDTARLELILMNLVSNAVKYSDPGKPHRIVSVETAPCDVAGFTCIAVRDNGLGIPPDRVSTIFTRFVRAHAERDTELRVRGSGLGLAIAAECAEAVGGAIRVDSEPGEGTTFFVDIPCEPAPPRVD
jgi:signal transduction histidine kinase